MASLVEIREMVNRHLINDTDFIKVKDRMNEDQLRAFVDQSIVDLCRDHGIRISPEDRMVLIRELVSAVVSLGPLRPLMEDKDITEIMINGYDKIYVQKFGKIHLSDIVFDSNAHLMHTVHKIMSAAGTNKRIDESSPYVDFSMPDGSRVNVILPPCSLMGPVMTIRKFKDDIATVENLLELEMIDEKIATLLVAAMKAKFNVIFCGSTGAGKTTMLNVFSRHIPSHERIITIEDTPELRLLQEHVVSLCSKPSNIEGKGEITIADLFINSLRMRPDRVIIGEVRGVEMLDLIQSISSGHSGSLAIVHAETPLDCFNRMVTMMLMTGIKLSTQEIQKQVARAIDLIVHVELFMDGRRRVTSVADVEYDEERDKTMLRDIFSFEEKSLTPEGKILGEWVHDHAKPQFAMKLIKRRVEMPQGFFEGV